MANLFYDLHMHSCLSPCGDRDMTPNNIVNMALIKGLNVIAVTDHNACDNVEAVMKVAQTTPLKVIPGVELATSEEVHIVCLFKDLLNCKAFCALIKKGLTVQNNPEIFGEQLILNSKDQVVGKREELLINASQISIDEMENLMEEYKGIAIAAHIEKPSTSVLSNLGFFPKEVHFDGKELYREKNLESLKEQGHIQDSDIVFVNSDAHYLWDISEAVHTIDEEVLCNLLKKR